ADDLGLRDHILGELGKVEGDLVPGAHRRRLSPGGPAEAELSLHRSGHLGALRTDPQAALDPGGVPAVGGHTLRALSTLVYSLHGSRMMCRRVSCPLSGWMATRWASGPGRPTGQGCPADMPPRPCLPRPRKAAFRTPEAHGRRPRPAGCPGR